MPHIPRYHPGGLVTASVAGLKSLGRVKINAQPKPKQQYTQVFI